MPRGSALSGLEKLLTAIATELKGLKKQVNKLGKKRGKPGRKPGRKPKKAARMGRPKTKVRVVKRRAGRKAGKKCSIRGCKKKQYAKGFCVNHYQQARRKARLKAAR